MSGFLCRGGCDPSFCPPARLSSWMQRARHLHLGASRPHPLEGGIICHFKLNASRVSILQSFSVHEVVKVPNQAGIFPYKIIY